MLCILQQPLCPFEKSVSQQEASVGLQCMEKPLQPRISIF